MKAGECTNYKDSIRMPQPPHIADSFWTINTLNGAHYVNVDINCKICKDSDCKINFACSFGYTWHDRLDPNYNHMEDYLYTIFFNIYGWDPTRLAFRPFDFDIMWDDATKDSCD